MENTIRKDMGGIMRILVTGADGMVGSAIKKVFNTHECIFTDKDELDVRFWCNWEKQFSYSPDLVINLAAKTDLEECENYPTEAYFTNTTGVHNAVEFCRELGIPLVHISTAGIFSGEHLGYCEDSQPDPINHYGRSKLYGDRIAESYRGTWIFRAGWMYGGGKGIDKKFVWKMIKQLDKPEIHAIGDIKGSPTYTMDLAMVIKNSVEKKIPYGTYNAAGLGIASRYDVAQFIVSTLKSKCKLTEVKREFFSDSFYCPRAQYEVLIMDKIQNQAISGLRYWKNSMEEYLKENYA